MNKLTVLLLICLIGLVGCAAPEESDDAAAAPVTDNGPTAETPIATETAVPTDTPPPTEEPAATETAVPFPTEVEVSIDPAQVEEAVEFEMRGAFDFFWEQANTDEDSPGYGLIRDRYPGSEGIASIASVGFGLTAYPIGVEKEYISFEEGYERANKTLDTLLAMERTEGFYYHFVAMETGERAWESEVSTIDTAILLMGVLTAGEYFGDEVADKAQEIYDGVNWPWFVDESRDMFYMAYRPEEGYAGHWDFYAEQLMLYVLAAGSDTYPIEDSTYYAFIRHYGSYGEGDGFIHSWFGSLFTYQFSHAWIDFRHYSDAEGVNWFVNSVTASQAQVDFALDKADEYNTLGPEAWGLTASDGPDGYNGLYGAPPSGYDNNSHVIDDTIPPAGAIGSIIFVPEAAQRALLNYYSLEALKSEYGFLDAYNLTEDWYASDVIGIDKGISLLMLANYENEFVHQIVMDNEQILNGLANLKFEQSE